MKYLLSLSLAVLLAAGCTYKKERDEEGNKTYSVQPGVETKAKDPVCGMQCDPKTALRAEHEGKTYYFCSEECRNKFKAAPESFVRR